MLGSANESKVFWLKPVNGKFELSLKEKREGFTEKMVETSDGRKITKYVKEFSFVSGQICDLVVEDTDYGRRWLVKVCDGDEVYNIAFKYSSGYSKSFLNQIENVDLSKPVTITCSVKEIEKNGKTIPNTALWIRQNEEWVGFKYTKDNPGNRPELKELTVKGEKIWDDTDQLKYYEAITTKMFNEYKLNSATSSTASTPAKSKPVAFSKDEEEFNLDSFLNSATDVNSW
jgi:hypothetical protein